MNVTVKYFAVCHEMLDRSEEEMDLPEGATVENNLTNGLRKSGPKSLSSTKSCKCLSIGNTLPKTLSLQRATRWL